MFYDLCMLQDNKWRTMNYSTEDPNFVCGSLSFKALSAFNLEYKTKQHLSVILMLFRTDFVLAFSLVSTTAFSAE